MRTPSIIRRWRTRLSDAQTNRLRVQLAAANDLNRSLEQRVAILQAANEGAYHVQSIASGNACLKDNCSLCRDASRAGLA
ncbi:hypothetical protein [Streptomyces bungoensis]|uniref:hypothetical protein n=1 Tax=Streptomyces bungoensis TaxID=285568 RepID=UPI003427699F